MDLKFNKFKTISDFNKVTINKGDVTFIEESKSILVDGVDYTGAKGNVQAINLFNYQDEDTPIAVSGPFDVYIGIDDPDDPEVYYSSHYRYMMYGNSIARFDCFFHSMETKDMGKGFIYSFLLRNEDGTWSHQGYLDVNNESIINPDFSLKEYSDDAAALADFKNMLMVVRKAFSEENSSPVFINLAEHTDGKDFSVTGPFLCYFDDVRHQYQSSKYVITAPIGGMIYRAERFDSILNDDYSTTGRIYCILNFDINKNTWKIYGWYNMETGKGYEADFETEVGETYFEGDSDVVLSMLKEREIQALTVKGDGTKFLADDGNYYEVAGSNSDNIRYYPSKTEWRADKTRSIPCICYIQDIDQIIIDNGAVIPDPYIWNFSDIGFSSITGTISTAKVVNDLTINPNCQINAYRTAINNVDYTYRLYLDAAGSATSRSVVFDLTGNDEIEVIYQTGNNRNLQLVKTDGTVIRSLTGTTAQSQTFRYNGEPCRAYLAMASGAGYVYCIKLNV